ncbi:alcohol dehydrogenase catalytic domain-containing protein [Mycobacterium sp. CVI_P3]|uniref:alcohol dehydrogenase n=1 Tax=Mycobacterium pinniadriaticum TaxID=2994102 RepID=A0ABT3SN39_9MYCO|nr:alcohol dehydrogenase catalytic domain-containing protein [Mycobacterium pinniadriaticum]MCX2934523.1 alcohol dehydrogenase catalytic domain-containing protein [Mycobacterium pinniadriaticum]MCX2940946.1 alcohol dehydrogenase catalytic domain-containing protein [Mycobacterium pinniadriaticum]
MANHRAVHVKSPGEPLELADVETTSPPPDHVRIAVNACGVCGTDHAFVTGAFPNLSWPVTPGHEIAGTIAELGSGVEGFAVGDRVAVGWFGGNCNTCLPCRKGQFMQCANLQVPSWNYPGGYAESVVAPRTALARIPDELSFAEAAPMGCAGVTTYNALRTTRAVAGDRVAVLGIGGLGHLGVQWSRAMGFETIAIARGAGKENDAKELGAHHYVDSTAGDVGQALQALGGAQVVLATAANSAAMAATVGGLAPQGKLVIIGATFDPLPISPGDLLFGNISVVGHPSGTSADIEDTLHFAVLSGVRARIQERPLAEAAEAYAAMDEGRARYRMVLTM